MAIWILAHSWQVGNAPDFQQYADAVGRFFAGEPLYGPDWLWRYSPVAILTFGPGIALGLTGWTLLHLSAVALIRPLKLAALFMLSWPFWVDVVSGNTVTFVATAGILAMRGSRIGVYSYWWLTMIMPRPFQLPLALYLVWRRPDLWRGLTVMIIVNVALVLVLGHWAEWVGYLVARGAEDTDAIFNIHPAADWGAVWLIVGIPLAALLSWRGWPGIGGVIVFPSLLPQYLLIAFVTPSRSSDPPGSPGSGSVTTLPGRSDESL